MHDLYTQFVLRYDFYASSLFASDLLIYLKILIVCFPRCSINCFRELLLLLLRLLITSFLIGKLSAFQNHFLFLSKWAGFCSSRNERQKIMFATQTTSPIRRLIAKSVTPNRMSKVPAPRKSYLKQKTKVMDVLAVDTTIIVTIAFQHRNRQSGLLLDLAISLEKHTDFA